MEQRIKDIIIMIMYSGEYEDMLADSNLLEREQLKSFKRLLDRTNHIDSVPLSALMYEVKSLRLHRRIIKHLTEFQSYTFQPTSKS